MHIDNQRRRVLFSLPAVPALLSLPVLGSMSEAAHAQQASTWPIKPVRIVVAAAAGGGTDVIARLVCDKLSLALKQSFIVDNRAGANGLLAAEIVSRAPADGYTLLFSYTAAMLINPALHEKSPIDPLKDFEPVAQVGSAGNLLVVTPDLPVRNLQDLVAYAKAQPGLLNYGSWGIGSGGHLVMESFLQQAGLSMNHVPYKGVAPLAIDLLGGTIKIGWVDVSSQLPHVQSGKLRAIAVSGSQRAPQSRDVPSMTEQGFRFDTNAWYGFFAPARTPALVVQRLNEEVVKAMRIPEMQTKLVQLNMSDVPVPSVEAFKRRVAEDSRIWHAIVQAAGIKPE